MPALVGGQEAGRQVIGTAALFFWLDLGGRVVTLVIEVDFAVSTLGKQVVLHALTNRAEAWIEGHIPEARRLRAGALIDERDVPAVVGAIRGAGLRV